MNDHTERDSRFLEMAIELSRKGMQNSQGGPFGCVVVRDEKVVGEGYNQVTSSNDPTAHAEVVAIRAACQKLGTYQLTECEIYTSCEPCPMCLASAYWARIDAIYYGANAADAAKAGFDDAFLYDEMRKQHAERTIPSTQMLREEAGESFKAWLESPNKIQY